MYAESRQGSAAGGPATDDEIEVTPEMIEAGYDAYFAVRRFPYDDLFDEEIAARVYRAMRRLSPEPA